MHFNQFVLSTAHPYELQKFLMGLFDLVPQVEKEGQSIALQGENWRCQLNLSDKKVIVGGASCHFWLDAEEWDDLTSKIEFISYRDQIDIPYTIEKQQLVAIDPDGREWLFERR